MDNKKLKSVNTTKRKTSSQQEIKEECKATTSLSMVLDGKCKMRNCIDKEYCLCDVVVANLICLFSIMLSIFLPVVNLALPFLLMIYFEVGIFSVLCKKEQGKPFKYEDLFVSLKKYLRIFCVYIAKIIITTFWLLVLVVPGVVCFLNYVFTPLILAENDELDARGVLMLSKELVYGHRWKIFLFMMISFVSVCVAVSSIFVIILLFDLFLYVPVVVYVVFVVLAAIFDLVLFALPLFEIVVVENYVLAKNNKRKI